MLHARPEDEPISPALLLTVAAEEDGATAEEGAAAEDESTADDDTPTDELTAADEDPTELDGAKEVPPDDDATPLLTSTAEDGPVDVPEASPPPGTNTGTHRPSTQWFRTVSQSLSPLQRVGGGGHPASSAAQKRAMGMVLMAPACRAPEPASITPWTDARPTT